MLVKVNIKLNKLIQEQKSLIHRPLSYATTSRLSIIYRYNFIQHTIVQSRHIIHNAPILTLQPSYVSFECVINNNNKSCTEDS